MFCDAVDKNGEKFVLYQQQYGNRAFWIRPYDMFFDKVSIVDDSGASQTVFRFTPPRKTHAPQEEIKELTELIPKEEVSIKHSETEEQYVITSISRESGSVVVQPYSHLQNGYEGFLTEYELIRRLGKNCCLIDNKLVVWDSKSQYAPQNQFAIEGYDNQTIVDMVNPCSIDLKIASSGFLKARRNTVDPESIEHASKASDLWYKVKLSKSKKKSTEYFTLRPGQTVLTHLDSRITLPADCAGKIEIKSSYARLSLSITSGDFCNPGYDGYFPLEITNFGKHRIIIHTRAVMAQLMLIPLNGPVLVEYSKKATQKNKDGYDDGTPYTFWRERSIKKLGKETGNESLIALYKEIRKSINKTTVDDINGTKDRFDDSFLTYCQNRMHKDKYKSKDNELPDVKKLLNDYIGREKGWRKIYGMRWASIVITVLTTIFAIVNFFRQGVEDPVIPFHNWYFAIPVIFAIVFLVFQIKKPKAFCTFEKIDTESIVEKVCHPVSEQDESSMT